VTKVYYRDGDTAVEIPLSADDALSKTEAASKYIPLSGSGKISGGLTTTQDLIGSELTIGYSDKKGGNLSFEPLSSADASPGGIKFRAYSSDGSFKAFNFYPSGDFKLPGNIYAGTHFLVGLQTTGVDVFGDQSWGHSGCLTLWNFNSATTSYLKGGFWLSVCDSNYDRKYLLEGQNNGCLMWGGYMQAQYFKATSDARLKDDIQDLKPRDFSGIKAYTYTLKKEEKKEKHIGLLAQEVQKVIPEAVSTDKDGYLSLDYNAVVAALVSEVNTLKKRLAALEGAA